MIQIGLNNSYVNIVDSETGNMVDAPLDFIMIRKRTQNATNYDFVYRNGNDVEIVKGTPLSSIPIASIEAINSEFTDYNASSFEDWYTTNIGISKLGINGGTA